MGLLNWIFKSKKNMAKSKTKRVRLGKYTISSHAQNKIAQKDRRLKKWDMLINLFGRNSKNSKLYVRDNAIQYDRVNSKNRTVTHITKKDKIVKSIRKYHNTKRDKQKVYKNF